jgi:hypothetical protein
MRRLDRLVRTRCYLGAAGAWREHVAPSPSSDACSDAPRFQPRIRAIRTNLADPGCPRVRPAERWKRTRYCDAFRDGAGRAPARPTHRGGKSHRCRQYHRHGGGRACRAGRLHRPCQLVHAQPRAGHLYDPAVRYVPRSRADHPAQQHAVGHGRPRATRMSRTSSPTRRPSVER